MYLKWEKTNLEPKAIIIMLVIIIAGYSLTLATASETTRENFQQMKEAALLQQEITAEVRELREELSFSINKEKDINKTGFIGEEFTELSTTRGQLEAKRTSTNPDFAALTVDYLKNELELEAGDRVAVGASGSFPALLAATVAAVEVLELEADIIYSLGSSYYGANQRGFTMVEIMDHLQKQVLITTEILALSIGGGGDIGQGMLLDPKELKADYSDDYNFIYEEDIADNIARRRDFYIKANTNEEKTKEKPGVFINIGGNIVNYGSELWDNGLLKPADFTDESTNRGDSLIASFLEKDIPVINFLNINDLAEEQGIEIDPQPLPDPGESELYYQVVYSRFIPLVTVILILTVGGIYKGGDIFNG